MSQSFPSWTGFQILACHNFPVVLKIVESLKLSSFICLFDQAIYSKVIEIKWKEKEKFKNGVLMTGMFHTIMMYLQILRKRFFDDGLL